MATKESAFPSFAKLGGDNYAIWAARMEGYLVVTGCWDAVAHMGEGVHPQNAMALARMLACVEDYHVPSLKACATAKDAWELLAAEFASQSYARKVQLKRDMVHLSYNSGESLQQYVARAKTLAGALNAAGCKVPAEDLLLSVLAGLPHAFDAAVTMLEASGESHTVDSVLPVLLAVQQLLECRSCRCQAAGLRACSRLRMHAPLRCFGCARGCRLAPRVA